MTERQGDASDMPEHERDDDVSRTVGGGILSEGGTSTDRGTGEQDGESRPNPDEDDQDDDEIAVRRMMPQSDDLDASE
jgi:hypothetical protein